MRGHAGYRVYRLRGLAFIVCAKLGRRSQGVNMQEERRPLDPTRRMLKIFGVKVTDYEERVAGILERASATSPADANELLRLAMEAIELTANLNAHVRDMNNHVLDTQSRVLSELRATLARGQP